MNKPNVLGQPLTPLDLFEAYGPVITSWPKAHCPGCKNELFFYGRAGLLLQVMGRKLGRHRAPGFHHYKNEGIGCDYADLDPPEYRNLDQSEVDPQKLEMFRQQAFEPQTLERTHQVIAFALKKSYTKQIVQDLFKEADKLRIWGWDIQQWEVPYTLLLLGEFPLKCEKDTYMFHFVRDKLEIGAPGLRKAFRGGKLLTKHPHDQPVPITEKDSFLQAKAVVNEPFYLAEHPPQLSPAPAPRGKAPIRTSCALQTARLLRRRKPAPAAENK